MDQLSQSLMMGAAGIDSSKLYVDDVFSTHLYTGTGSAQSINNGIDLSGEGGMVWIKTRGEAYDHNLFDTARGVGRALQSNADSGELTLDTNKISAFNNNGFTLGNEATVNADTKNVCSWTFRKAKNFFDIQTWTGNNTGGRTISHNLGSVPGMILIKSLNQEHWAVYHRSITAEKWLSLSSSSAVADSSYLFDDTEPTSSVFSVGSNAYTNGNGVNYVAYIFAHDAGGFGEAADQSIIKCGKYTGNGSSTGPVVDLGWEPQYILIKSTGSNSWYQLDAMRGLGSVSNTDSGLIPNDNAAETGSGGAENVMNLTSTGFELKHNGGYYNTNAVDYIYMAIRRSDGAVGKPIEVATKCFDMDAGDSGTLPNYDCGFPVDMALMKVVDSVDNWELGARVIAAAPGDNATYLKVDTSNQGFADANWRFDSMSGFHNHTYGTSYQGWMWKRHKGFDCTTYKATGTAGQSYSHSLGAVPEMIWIKRISAGAEWQVGHKGLHGGTDPWDYVMTFNQIGAEGDHPHFYDTAPTSTTVKLGDHGNVNEVDNYYFMALFASVEGISSVGYWTGDGTSNDSKAITTGFSPRFVLIKRANGNGNWLVIDTVRGAGNYLRLHSNMAQSSGTMITLTATGFTFPTADSDVNSNGDTYIYYAHA